METLVVLLELRFTNGLKVLKEGNLMPFYVALHCQLQVSFVFLKNTFKVT